MKHGGLWEIHMFSWWKGREGRVSCTVRLPLKGNIVNWVADVRIAKLTFRALVLRQSKWRNCGFCMFLLRRSGKNWHHWAKASFKTVYLLFVSRSCGWNYCNSSFSFTAWRICATLLNEVSVSILTVSDLLFTWKIQQVWFLISLLRV